MNAAQLKASILQQAIEGKLVPQLPEEGVIEQIGPAPSEVPFEIPHNWSACKLSDVAELITDGSHNPPPNTGSGIPVLSAKDLTNGFLTDDNASRWTDEEHWTSEFKRCPVQMDDIVLCIVGSIGKVGRVRVETKVMLQRSLALIRVNESIITKDFFEVFLNSLFCQKWLIKGSAGTAQKGIYLKSIRALPVVLPPITEQKRIVAKIEELMPLVEEYGKAYDKLQELNDELPGKLKASILQEAIQGKLVPQLPEEGVVEQIGEAPAEVTFELPASWKWCKLESIASIVRGASPRPIKNFLTTDEDGINWIKIGDSERGSKYISKCAEKITYDGSLKSRFVKRGSLLLTNSMSYGYPYILNVDGCIHDGWLSLSDFDNFINKEFLYYMLLSNYCRSVFVNKAAGAVVKNLNIDKVKSVYIPLPPLAEQKRIVAKIEALFEQIDLMTK